MKSHKGTGTAHCRWVSSSTMTACLPVTTKKFCLTESWNQTWSLAHCKLHLKLKSTYLASHDNLPFNYIYLHYFKLRLNLFRATEQHDKKQKWISQARAIVKRKMAKIFICLTEYLKFLNHWLTLHKWNTILLQVFTKTVRRNSVLLSAWLHAQEYSLDVPHCLCNSYISTVLEPGSSGNYLLSSHWRGPSSISELSTWDLLQTKWNCGRFFSRHFVFPCQLYSPNASYSCHNELVHYANVRPQ